MKRFITIALVAVLCMLLGGLKKAGASHLMGSDIIYTCLGNGKYEITVRVYRDCNGIQLSQSPIILKCSTTTLTITNQTKVSVRDITGIDPSCPTQSRCQNQWAYGIEEHVFKATVDLSSYNCCEWEISWAQSARNSNITVGMANQDFYTFAKLNKCVTPCNSSPDFTNPPIAIMCYNQDFVFNNGALDTLDVGDSLSYELAPAFRAANTVVTYNPPYSYNLPVCFFGFPNKGLNSPAGFQLNAVTGDITFRPTCLNQIAVIVVEVKEWRKVNGVMTVVGVTRRDMQIIVINCPNNKVPKIKPPYYTEACAGQTVCVDIETEDQDQNDTVRITWNRGIPGATFSNTNGQKKHADGQVCWTPNESHISNVPHTFTITAKDNSCDPFPGQSVRAFSIRVNETPKADLDVEVLQCGFVALSHTPLKTYPGYAFEYDIRNESNNSVWKGNEQIDTAFLQPGKYRVILEMRTPKCMNLTYDTIEVPDFVTVRLPEDTLQCEGIPILLESETRHGTAPYEYEWARMTPDSAGDLANPYEDLLVSQDSGNTYLIRVKDAEGCRNYDTVFVGWHTRPVFTLGPDQRICIGNSITLSSPLDSTHSYVWSTGDTSESVDLRDSNTYWLKAMDEAGCTWTDSFNLFVNKVVPDAGPDRSICRNAPVTLNAAGADTYAWYLSEQFNANPNNPPLSAGKTLNYTITKDQVFILKGTATLQGVSCVGYDSVQIRMDELPEIIFNQAPQFCENDIPYSLLSLIQYPTLFNGAWSSTDVPQAISNGMFFPNLAGPSSGQGHLLTYTVTDAKGCTNQSDIRIKVNPKPAVELVENASFCGDFGILGLNVLKLQPSATFNGTPKWYSANQNSQIDQAINKQNIHDQKLDLSKVPQGNTYPLVFEFKSNTTGCINRDTVALEIKTVPNTKAGQVPDLCWNDDPYDLTLAGASPVGGTWSSPDMVLNGTMLNPAAIGEDKKYLPGTDIRLIYTFTLNGCSKSDTIKIRIKGIPNLQLSDPEGWCASAGVQNLNPYTNLPGGIWSGPGVTGHTFDPMAAGVGDNHGLTYTLTDPLSRCKVSEEISVRVQAIPEIELVTSDKACAGEPYGIEISLTNAGSMEIHSSGDGEFDYAGSGLQSSTLSSTKYFPGMADLQQLHFVLTAQTTNNGLCPAAEVSRAVEIFALPEISLSGGPLVDCDPLETELTVQSNAMPGSEYRWTYSDGRSQSGIDLTGVNETFSGPGTYLVQVEVQNTPEQGSCVSLPEEIELTVLPTPNASFTANRWRTTVALPGIQFEDLSTIESPAQLTEWSWEFGDRNHSGSSERNPYFEYPVEDPLLDTGSFMVRLIVTADNQCQDIDTGYIHIAPDLTVFIPNAFTPNKFGPVNNNRFFVVADGFDQFEITIFNRWGERVYQSDNILEGWDGNYKGVEAQQDVYMYVVKITSLAGKEFQYYGTITLLR